MSSLLHAWNERRAGSEQVTRAAACSPRVQSYIPNQKAHHRRANFEEELVRLLKKHRIGFDPAYLFD